MTGIMELEVPAESGLAEALRRESARTSQRISLVGQFDIAAYNPETRLFQVWGHRNGRNTVILSQKIELRDMQHFADLVILVGKVAHLSGSITLLGVLKPWWAYRYI